MLTIEEQIVLAASVVFGILLLFCLFIMIFILFCRDKQCCCFEKNNGESERFLLESINSHDEDELSK